MEGTMVIYLFFSFKPMNKKRGGKRPMCHNYGPMQLALFLFFLIFNNIIKIEEANKSGNSRSCNILTESLSLRTEQLQHQPHHQHHQHHQRPLSSRTAGLMPSKRADKHSICTCRCRGKGAGPKVTTPGKTLWPMDVTESQREGGHGGKLFMMFQ